MAPSAVENGVMAPMPLLQPDQLDPKTENTTSIISETAISSGGPAVELAINGKVDEVEEVTKVGMECDLKNLYQKEDDRGRHTWTDKYPDDLDEAAENEITARYAILVRNKKSFDSRKKLEIDSIVVQSPLLKNVLSKILKDYPGKLNF
jgi:hypothetical protein